MEPFDTTELCQLIDMSHDTLFNKLSRMKRFRRVKQIFKKNIPEKNIPKLISVMYKYKGFELIERFIRNYPGNCGSHLLGYVREVDRNILNKKPYYRPRDLIGISGLEKQYEAQLRGVRGKNQYLRDAHGNLKETLAVNNGLSGKNLTSTIDIQIQKYGEQLMQNKIGSIVAIEPSTGEILAMISAPSFNPNKLTGDSLPYNWRKLALNDSLNPLFNRALSSKYSPGSIFKMIGGLAAWEKGVINQNTKIFCDKSIVGCHNHKPTQNLADAIKYSCNPYFYEAFKRFTTSQKGDNLHKKSKIGFP
jgi:penicillin-binding protein 2